MKKVYIVQYWHEDTAFMWQIYTVTTSLEYATDCIRMLDERDDVIQAGYETHDLVELEELVAEN